jgi:hypothetical protein
MLRIEKGSPRELVFLFPGYRYSVPLLWRFLSFLLPARLCTLLRYLRSSSFVQRRKSLRYPLFATFSAKGHCRRILPFCHLDNLPITAKGIDCGKRLWHAET